MTHKKLLTIVCAVSSVLAVSCNQQEAKPLTNVDSISQKTIEANKTVTIKDQLTHQFSHFLLLLL